MEPATPPEVLARRKGSAWKPDGQGRLTFRPRGLFGPVYVVETIEQLDRIEKFAKTRALLLVVLIGSTLYGTLHTQSPTDLGTVYGQIAVVVAIVVALLGYIFIAGPRIVAATAMRRRP